MADAEELLSKFMVKGLPDPDLFLSSVSKRVMGLKTTPRDRNQGVVVFGEMVSVPWDKGNKTGALALEALESST
jgi:hypothetical protein